MSLLKLRYWSAADVETDTKNLINCTDTIMNIQEESFTYSMCKQIGIQLVS